MVFPCLTRQELWCSELVPLHGKDAADAELLLALEDLAPPFVVVTATLGQLRVDPLAGHGPHQVILGVGIPHGVGRRLPAVFVVERQQLIIVAPT